VPHAVKHRNGVQTEVQTEAQTEVWHGCHKSTARWKYSGNTAARTPILC